MMKNRNLIFDLDGTLWNTQKACVQAWNQAIQRRKVIREAITEVDISSMMGLTTEEMRVKFFSSLSRDDGLALLQECFRQEIMVIENSGSFVYPDVMSSLQQLKEHYDLYIVSNCEMDYLNLFLDVNRVRDLFKDWDCYGNTLQPKGLTIKGLMQRNDLQDAIYIGDTQHDQDACDLANIPFYFLQYGFGRASNPEKSFVDFRELADHLLG